VTPPVPPASQSLRAALAGRRVLVTGATGFVGECLLERLLADLPETSIVLVVRPQGRRTGRDRVAQTLRKPAFGPLRVRDGDEAVDALLDSRIQVIEGDLSAALPALPGDLDTVIHCAGEVSFDMPVDEAFTNNLLGAQRLLAAVRASGSRPHWLQVSTAYVAGLRQGWVAEESHQHRVDWATEMAAGLAQRGIAEAESRSPAVLQELVAEARGTFASAGSQEVAVETERLRVRWVRMRLIDAGRERAQSLGWTDAYTFTKALTERMVEQECAAWGVPLTIVRPSIVESALRSPYPGWIEGFKVAEPIIIAYGRGQLPDFPAAPDAAIDIVPVDVLVNGMLCAAAHAPPVESPRYLHLGTSARNPLPFRRLYELVRDYFIAHPFPAREGGHTLVPTWAFSTEASIERRLRLAERAHKVSDRAVGWLPPGQRSRDLARTVDRNATQLRQVRKLADLYRPYTQAELVYGDDEVLALHRSMSPQDQHDFGFDVADPERGVEWRHYLVDLHCPSVTAGLRWLATLPPQPAPVHPEPAAKVARTDAGQVVAAFDLDGTLVSSTVVEAYVWSRLAELSGTARARELAGVVRDVPRFLLQDRHSRSTLLRTLYTRYAGADPEALLRLVDDDVASMVLARTSAPALRRVREHRAAGHRTVLVTGALDLLTRPLAPLFDEVRAVTLVVGADGRFTGRLVEPPVIAEARAAWLRRRAATGGWDLAASYAYADSASDLPMLRAVGHPVAVNPDNDLLRVATRAGWPTERWPSTPGAGGLALPPVAVGTWG